MSSIVGAMSLRRPLRTLPGWLTMIRGTGFRVWAVWTPPVTGSIIISALPWSAVIRAVPPTCSIAPIT
ncbi:hypothetical protein D3C84_1227840 [compost metagenome]